MSDQVKEIIRKTVIQMLDDSMSANNIHKMGRIHKAKVHFVPIRYRIIGGVLQGLNIKLGNFIEQLLRNIIEIDTGVNAMEDSGKKIKLFFTHTKQMRSSTLISRNVNYRTAQMIAQKFSMLCYIRSCK